MIILEHTVHIISTEELISLEIRNSSRNRY